MNRNYQELLRTELNRITAGEPPMQDFFREGRRGSPKSNFSRRK